MKKVKYVSVAILIILLMILALYIPVTNSSWYQNRQMKITALEWCGLAETGTIENEEFEITGGIFTRGCIWEFTMPKRNLENWITASPGLQNPTKIKEFNKAHKIYYVKPRDGAVWGEVEIDLNSGSVRINTYWS